jgi:pantoate--beta-alanine ligase
VAGAEDCAEGGARPGFFRGVSTVCAKLFNLVEPTHAFFGQKDAQQAAVIRRVVDELNFGLELVVCDTARDADGLAMSSRNRYLSPEERQRAPALHAALRRGAEAARGGEAASVAAVCAAVRDRLREEPAFAVDYVAVSDALTMEPLEDLALAGSGGVCLSAAAVLGTTRLIDNVVVRV